MRITFLPQLRDGVLTVIKSGDQLSINGELFSFEALPDGATIPAGKIPFEWIFGEVERINGKVNLTLFLPHGPSPSASVAYPEAIIDPPDGPLSIPHDEAEELEHVDGQ